MLKMLRWRCSLRKLWQELKRSFQCDLVDDDGLGQGVHPTSSFAHVWLDRPIPREGPQNRGHSSIDQRYRDLCSSISASITFIDRPEKGGLTGPYVFESLV